MDPEQARLEHKKLALEERKLALERTKVRWTGAAVIISVVSITVTVGWGALSLRRTSEDQLAAKLAEITFTSENPRVGAGKAAALGYLFSDRLPSSLSSKLKDYDVLSKQLIKHGGAIGPSLDSQMQLLQMVLAASPKDRQRVLLTWKAMFPADTTWVDEFAKALPPD